MIMNCQLNKNKSFIFSKYDEEPETEKKEKIDIGSKILLAIDDYTKLEKEAEEILKEEENRNKSALYMDDDDSVRYSRKNCCKSKSKFSTKN